MTREEQCALVLATASPSLLDEVQYHLHGVERDPEGWPEGSYDAVSALYDAEDRAEDAGNRALTVACRRVFIDLGCYRVADQEELDRTYCSHGSGYAFRLNGHSWVAVDDNPAPQFLD